MKIVCTRPNASALMWCFLTAALTISGCRDHVPTAPEMAAIVHAPALDVDDPPQFTDWSTPINLGATANSSANDQGPFISKDGLSLYFTSTRVGGFGGNDIWVTRRAHKDDPWGLPMNLGSTINTAAVESTPTLSRDGSRLYFASGRPGGVGGIDIWVSERADPDDDLGWQTPTNLGTAINSTAADLGPAFFIDPNTERLTMYFYSTRAGGPGVRDIYTSTVDDNGEFTPATLVAELSTAFEDEQPSLRHDGLEIYFASNRPGSLSTTVTDIWVARRANTSLPWSQPVNVGPTINTAGLEARPSLSFNGRTLYFFSDGHGGFGATDLFMSQRRPTDGDGEAAALRDQR